MFKGYKRIVMNAPWKRIETNHWNHELKTRNTGWYNSHFQRTIWNCPEPLPIQYKTWVPVQSGINDYLSSESGWCESARAEKREKRFRMK